MTKRNLTVQLDEEVVRRARVVAANRGTSVSGLVTLHLSELADAEDRYEHAQELARETMESATHGGGRSWTRDELHGR